jgi:hypothetical protein
LYTPEDEEIILQAGYPISSTFLLVSQFGVFNNHQLQADTGLKQDLF